MGMIIFSIETIIIKIITSIKHLKNKYLFRKHNKHNYVVLGDKYKNRNLDINLIQVGNHSYGCLNVHSFKSKNEKLIIGSYCSIGDNVSFILGGEHHYKKILNYPIHFYTGKNIEEDSFSKGPIVLEDDVWIGENCTILSGVRVGQGAVIGAGSIVSKDVPPYSIYAGGKIIKYRFDEDMIKKLLNIDFSKCSLNMINENFDLFNRQIDKFSKVIIEQNIKTIFN